MRAGLIGSELESSAGQPVEIQTATQILQAISAGDTQRVDDLFSLVYDQLKAIARRHLSRGGEQGLSSSELVHEAYLKLIDQKSANWTSKTHFFALGSRVMRQILVDQARRKQAKKRGGTQNRLNLDDAALDPRIETHVIAVETALRLLETVDPQQAKIVEMRFFAGMTVEDVAECLGKSKRWVESEWTMIKAWLRNELSISE